MCLMFNLFYIVKAIHLIEASVCSDSVGMDNTAELWKDLEQEVIRVKEATKSNHKEAKV